jgi:pimeloyl-ACP methyl ester carboxylesterase
MTFLAVALALAAPARAAELVALKTRPGVEQRYLFLHDPGVKYEAAAILFAGNGGDIRLKPGEGATSPLKGNFLVRAKRRFVDEGVAVAVIDAPSDMPGGMNNLFRRGSKHQADVAAVVRDLKARVPGAKIFLVGHSLGSVSAAAGAVALAGEIDGAVLASAPFADAGKYGAGLNGFDFSAIKAPLLFVHHADDACDASPYYKATRAAKPYVLVTVRGGKSRRSDPCDTLSPHGFYGKEEEVVAAIAAWMRGRAFARELR